MEWLSGASGVQAVHSDGRDGAASFSLYPPLKRKQEKSMKRKKGALENKTRFHRMENNPCVRKEQLGNNECGALCSKLNRTKIKQSRDAQGSCDGGAEINKLENKECKFIPA